MDWFILALRNSFDFTGRARRREHGWFLLVSGLISMFFDIFEEASLALALPSTATFFAVVNGIISLTLIMPQISVTTRRLHDLGYSGLWQLIPLCGWLLVWMLGFILLGANIVSQPDLISFSGTFGIITLLVFFINLGMGLWLIFKDGQKHPNKYGESPKYPSQAEPEKPTTTLVS